MFSRKTILSIILCTQWAVSYAESTADKTSNENEKTFWEKMAEQGVEYRGLGKLRLSLQYETIPI